MIKKRKKEKTSVHGYLARDRKGKTADKTSSENKNNVQFTGLFMITLTSFVSPGWDWLQCLILERVGRKGRLDASQSGNRSCDTQPKHLMLDIPSKHYREEHPLEQFILVLLSFFTHTFMFCNSYVKRHALLRH